MRSNIIWSGLLCGAILLGGHELRFAVAASDPAVPVTNIPAPPQVRSSLAASDPAASVVMAPDEDNTFRYEIVVQQNAFRLNPAPPPPGPPQPPPPDLPTVKLSGTRTEGDKIWAMFAVSTKKTPKDPKETTSYYSLAEGEVGGPVKVLKISPDGNEVTILNSDTQVVLTMKDNGFDSKPTAPAGPGTPGVIRTATPIRGNPAVPTMPAMPAPSAAPGSQAINLGNSTGGGPSSRTEMIVGGNMGVAASRTASPQPIVASSGSTGDLKIGGFTPPPAAPTAPGPNPIPIPNPTPGGTPPNYATPGPIRTDVPMPPMPTLPTIGR
jgi:hypothetical protein